MSFSELSDYIILFGALTVALTNIYNFLAKPHKKLKSKKEAEIKEQIERTLEEKMPSILEKHSKEVAQERNNERLEQLEEIRSSILEETKTVLDGILQINLEQSKNISTLMTSSKDVLRQRIMDIYHKYKKDKQLPIYSREALDELYKDYKAENGNSYIDKYYSRMRMWPTYDEYDNYDNE